ncbi:MAG: 50S ribosomal protein L9, partial [Propionibacteriaceae bacterium]|nr:50S ribosomal protein L9 [Propionibacteriaceae bacterium]
GRNYLVPQGKAIVWSRGAEKQIEGIKRARDAREIRGIEHAEEIRTQIEDLTVQVGVRVSESGSLFGSVTVAELAKAIKKAGGPAVDKRAITFAKPVKRVGNHSATIKLHPAVNAHLTFEVVPA